MKRIIISILFIIPLPVWGQKITFSSEIQNTKDSSIIEVRDLWLAYVTNCQKGFDKSSFDYWNKYETEQGFTDIVKAAITLPSYLIGELAVFNIKKVDNDYYRIRNIWSIGDTNSKSYLAIFNVFAKKTNSVYKLYNNFYLVKPKLQHYQIANFDYYYPSTYSFNSQKANQMAEFYSKISLMYGNTGSRKVIYIVGNNLDEANNIIGFDYTMWSSSYPDAAYTIKGQNIILARREDYIHEIIHSIFMPMFLKANALFHEGIATYYGGSAGQNYSNLIKQLGNMINTNPDIDLSKFDSLFKVLDNGTNYFYTIGAIFIDYAFKIGGTKKVLALFQYPDSTDNAISAIEKELGIKKNQIDSFLKKYVQNYKGN
jgi:hypothetical protein